jgi:SNF2 family DNA or RNA helicase
MPPVIQETIYIDLPPDARSKYRDIEEDFITQVEAGTIVAANTAVAGGKCRQICNGALYINKEHEWEPIHAAKLEALGDLIEQLGGAPTLVMYEFNHDKARILGRYGSDLPVLGGGTSAGQSLQYIQEFNDGKHPLMICHPASMAHGLNLQEACHHIIWFGITWNLEHYDQSVARVYRQGQKFPVMVYHILARDTLDDRVMDVLKEKDHNQQMLFKSLSK